MCVILNKAKPIKVQNSSFIYKFFLDAPIPSKIRSSTQRAGCIKSSSKSTKLQSSMQGTLLPQECLPSLRRTDERVVLKICFTGSVCGSSDKIPPRFCLIRPISPTRSDPRCDHPLMPNCRHSGQADRPIEPCSATHPTQLHVSHLQGRKAIVS